MSGNQAYMVIFKDDVTKAQIKEEVSKVESAGGKITRQFDSDIMKGFAAQLPSSLVQSYTSLTDGGKHDYLAYIEPDQKVSTMDD